MNQEKNDSDNDSSSDSHSDSSSDSDSDSGSGSSSSSSSGPDSGDSNNETESNEQSVQEHPHQHQPQTQHNQQQQQHHQHTVVTHNGNGEQLNSANNSDESSEDDVENILNREHAGNHGAYNSEKSSPDDDDYPTRRNVRPRRDTKPKAAPPVRKKKKTGWNSGTSSSESESEEERPTRRAPPVHKKKVTKKQKSYSSDESDSDEENQRLATRRATAAAVSYKEASEDEKTGSDELIDPEFDEDSPAHAAALLAAAEDEKCETIERIIAKRLGLRGITGNQTTTYAVEDNGDPNALSVNVQDRKTLEPQFLIKWKGWSNIHNTWESEVSLREQKVKGMKKLENYIKREREIEIWRRHAGPEDIDYYECQLELHNELQKSYNFVDRIIAQTTRDNVGGDDYLCKWESLPYSEATWEDASLVERKWPRKISDFRGREGSTRTPSTHSRILKDRPKFLHLKAQPKFMGVERGLFLRDYQMDGLNWLILTWCKQNSVILADEMGLGKTIQTICFLYYLFTVQSLHGPFLCVVPLSTMTAWQREFDLWAPEMNIVTYLGDVQSREIIRQYEWSFKSSKRLKFNAILTTYEILLKDKAFLGCINWAALLVDEAHRLKNDDSLLYKALKEFDTNHRLLITGTPLQNSLKELWALLHFIMPTKFVTWEEFEVVHGNAADKGYTKLHKQLEPYILRRVKKDVEKSLPAKVEQILRVEMTSVQKQYYKWILTKNFNALRKGVKGSMSTFLNIVIELKKCCNHAILIRPVEYEAYITHDDAVQQLLRGSGKLVLLDKLLCRLRETGHRVLIFSQMVRMLDILAEYLQKRHFPFQRLDGSIKGEIRKQALDHFNADGSTDFCFLLSTRAGGLGINLATADTVIIFDSDWNPQNDLQAQARAHRIGQKNQVNIYRLVTARSVEEEIVERAKQKMVLDHLVIQRMDTTGRTVLDKTGATPTTTPFNKEDLSAILKFGAEELFKDEQENDDDLVCDIDEILRRAETRDEGPAMAGDELLSAFKVASFAAFDEDDKPAERKPMPNAAKNDKGERRDWEEIIPSNFRDAIDAEERNREMSDMYLPPRRKTPAQLNQVPNDASGSRKRKKMTEDESDDGSDMSVGGGGGGSDDRPRKRGRPPIKEKISGFTDAELRRFIRSYKKFPAPLKRLEAIALDAELQEKPLADLKKIGQMLHDRCVAFLGEHSKEVEPEANAVTGKGKKRGVRAGFSVKFGGVSFNAKTLMQYEDELRPLDEVIPAAADERTRWVLEIKTRPANFDHEWTVQHDSRLLCGIYQYGIGSWEAMKMDPSLGIADRILSNDNRKPQAKHLQSRAEYLLKIIRKNIELKKGIMKQKRPRKTKAALSGGTTIAAPVPTATAPAVKDFKLELEDISSGEDRRFCKRDSNESGAAVTVAEDVVNGVTSTPTAGASSSTNRKAKVKHSKEAKKAKKKSDGGPMHFTANNEPRALDVLGDLDPNVFNECKEKMRPVKKALKALDNPDQDLPAPEQVTHTRACLLSIGKQIDECLAEYKEPDKIKEWRSNLWYFVSKFTEYDAKKLFKLYKHALKRSKDGASPSSSMNECIVSPSQRPESSRERTHKDSSSEKERKDSKKSSASRDDSAKRRLEEGECEPDSKEYKRVHGGGDSRNREREKSDRTPTSASAAAAAGSIPNSSDRVRIRRNSGASSSSVVIAPPIPRSAAPTTPQRVPAYQEARDVRPPNSSYSEAVPIDRWNSRERYDKRDRYEYNRVPQTYHRDQRDHRDRDRDHRRLDKRRYPPMPMGYSSGHYLPQSSYYPGDVPPSGYRDRYAPQGGSEWNRDREYVDYRHEYDRRPPPANS